MFHYNYSYIYTYIYHSNSRVSYKIYQKYYFLVISMQDS